MRIPIKTMAATLASILALTLVASALPFWRAKDSSPAETDPAMLAPGDTLLVTDGAVLEHTMGVAITLVTADPPPPGEG